MRASCFIRRLLLQADGGCPTHTFRRIVHRSAEAAGLEINVTPHTFRRSCTTELIRGGANPYHVKELLGHENLETFKHYTKLTMEDLKATHARCHPRETERPARTNGCSDKVQAGFSALKQ